MSMAVSDERCSRSRIYTDPTLPPGGTSSAGAGTGIQASPLPLQRLQLEESYNGTGGSPMSPPRSTMIRRESHVLADISENELLDTDEALQTISAMFPTVSESHIKELLTK